MRRVCLDNLKVLLIAGIIALHGLLGYSDLDVWPYGLVRETTLAPVTSGIAMAAAGPFAIFLIALLFLVAGLLAPESLARKGAGRFARDRLLRLGVPFLFFVLVLWPALLYALYRPLGHVTGSYWREQLSNTPDNGPLWFVGVLLLFSLLYAGWSAARPPGLGSRQHLAITAGRLGLLALAVALGWFAIRLGIPYGSEAPLDLNEWQWPECAALFGLGIAASRRGWLDEVPRPLARRAGQVAVGTALATTAYAASAEPLGIEFVDLLGGWQWEALLFALLEGLLTVFGSVWLLSVAQRRLDRQLPHGRELARCSYGAFIIQGVPVLGLAVALRPVPLPAEVKALVVMVASVVASFALAWLLVTRVRPLARIL